MQEQMPAHYMVCLNASCPRAETCLRQMFSNQYPAERFSVHALNPQLYPKEHGECKYYRPMQKVRLAWGIKDLLREIPYDKARSIKNEMLAHFGRTKYYRFFREERPLTPKDQTAIQKIFRQHQAGITPEYARYSEEIEW